MRLKRWEVVLKYIVEDYIESAEPVGSKTLLKNHKLQYSSATIRNEMAYLEDLGYIEKTHTSSGRVPSTEGYRYYVTKLRSEKIDKSIKYEIDRLVDSCTSIEDLLYSSCEMLSNMTRLACCYLGPNVFDERLAKVEIIKLASNKFTFLFITDRGYLENKTFVEKEDKIKRLIECVNKLDEEITSVRLVNIFEKLNEVKANYQDYISEFDYITKLFVSMLKDFLIKRNSQFYGKDYLPRPAAVAEKAESERGALPLEEELLPFVAEPLAREAVLREGAAELDRLGGDLEFESGDELHEPEDAEGILGEVGADVAQHAPTEVVLAVPGVDELAGEGVAEDGVDGEVAAGGRLGVGEVRVGGDGEVAVPGAQPRLAAGQGHVDVKAVELDDAEGGADLV